jgi:hypothetical protein
VVSRNELGKEFGKLSQLDDRGWGVIPKIPLGLCSEGRKPNVVPLQKAEIRRSQQCAFSPGGKMAQFPQRVSAIYGEAPRAGLTFVLSTNRSSCRRRERRVALILNVRALA